MNFTEELQKLNRRMYDYSLAARMFTEHNEELVKGGHGNVELIFSRDLRMLEKQLNPESWAKVLELMSFLREAAVMDMETAFQQGVYAAFRDYFDPRRRGEEDPVHAELGSLTGNAAALRAGLRREMRRQQGQPPQGASPDSMVADAWAERRHGISRYSYYLGYRWAIDLLEEMDGPSVREEMGACLSRLEKYLSFTQPQEAREREWRDTDPDGWAVRKL